MSNNIFKTARKSNNRSNDRHYLSNSFRSTNEPVVQKFEIKEEDFPELQIEESSLDMSDLDQGIVRYMVGVPDESITASIDDFNIIVKKASKKN